MTDTGTFRQRLGNAADAFDVTVLGAERQAVRTVLFAAGRGGNPLRHRPLLDHLATLGCRVIAPHFDHLPSPLPSGPELRERCRRLQTAAAELADRAAPAIGVGHSIGAALLLALAGADLETVDGERLSPGISRRLERLALMAPPADFFRRPGALRALTIPIGIWAGGRDTVTPPGQGLYLRDALSLHAPVEIHVEDEAGHFSFMDEPPPGVPDTHPDRAGFLSALADAVGRFIVA